MAGQSGVTSPLDFLSSRGLSGRAASIGPMFPSSFGMNPLRMQPPSVAAIAKAMQVILIMIRDCNTARRLVGATNHTWHGRSTLYDSDSDSAVE